MNEEFEDFEAAARVTPSKLAGFQKVFEQCPNSPSPDFQLYQMEVTVLASSVSNIVYQTCFNEITLASIWSRHVNKRRADSKREGDWDDFNLIRGNEITEAYIENHANGWKKTIMSEAGYPTENELEIELKNPVTNKKDIITKGHFTPSSDFESTEDRSV